MAYGKNKERKDWLMRAMPLAVGKLPKGKLAELACLQSRVLDLMRAMALACFAPEPLADTSTAKAREAQLIAMQKAQLGLNSVWCEQARMRVTPALEEAHHRYFARLIGSLRFVDSLIPVATDQPTAAQQRKLKVFIGPPPPRRRYFHVPRALQDEVTPAELAALKLIGEGVGAGGAIALFRRVILDGDVTGLTAIQVAIVRAIHARALESHAPLQFGAAAEFTLQLHLDYRMLPSVKRKGLPDCASEALNLRAGEAYLLADDDNKLYRRFLDISGVAPHAPRIRLPVILTKEIARRLKDTRADWSSLIVELTSSGEQLTGVGVRLVCGKPEPDASVDLHHVTAIVGRDFGYTNTICLAVAVSETPIDLSESTSAVRASSALAARHFFETHVLPPDVRIAERVQFSGRRFMARIETHCIRIDRLTSRIDLAYDALHAVRAQVFGELGLAFEDSITPGLKKTLAGALVGQFYHQLGQIADLKQARRALYERIARLKRCWFGYLANAEVALAKKYHAVIVHEDLTVEAIEKDSPQYKGRVFNKMLNNGSKGQYQRRATNTHAWNGIPERKVGSWYTSRACITHSQVLHRKHRKGEMLNLPCCGKSDHADLHASETIACYLFLRPVSPSPGHRRVVREKHAEADVG